MHLPINVKSPSNISKWQMGFNSAFKGLREDKLLKGAGCKTVSFSKRKGKGVTAQGNNTILLRKI